MAVKASLAWLRSSSISVAEKLMNSASGVCPLSAMMDYGRGKGAVANSSVFIKENIDELTPMPSARVSSEIRVKPGDASRVRRA